MSANRSRPRGPDRAAGAQPQQYLGKDRLPGYAIDVATGVKLWEYYNDATGDDRQFMNYSLAASPTLLDSDGDGYVDRMLIWRR